MGYSVLNGLLQSTTMLVSPAQLLDLVESPLVLLASPGAGVANLLKKLVVSLRFATTPYVASWGAGCCVFYGGSRRFPVTGGFAGPPLGPSFAATAVGNASGGLTTYTTPSLRGAPANLFAGLWCNCSLFAHAANNGRFQCSSNTTGALVLANASGVSDAGGAVNVEVPGWSFGVGGQNDLAGLLTTAIASTLTELEIPTPWSYPRVDIEAAPILLGNPLTALGGAADLTTGDSSLLLTAEFFQLQL
jgi:hypothetical protein